MKNVVIILFLIALPTFGMAQDTTVAVSTPTEQSIEVSPKKETVKSSALSTKLKTQLIKLNHKKSNEIISIKAYRKSLQIKVKTVKLC
ncbi:hypothetical protein RM697_03785 [Ichthyenterobacterium sp. W332]|uniref:Uncharacterized protein n=1 Tax=Microcosmobacter mediterraneus TaxID=3075607 RepID=A0ABU2YHV1_9FLAO|nr:hypothetical protein [Ichthyenterobacterium sp. W332]MDT0557751.1 hypothetical protein [Ichthyenterobacterium sp. W332]